MFSLHGLWNNYSFSLYGPLLRPDKRYEIRGCGKYRKLGMKYIKIESQEWNYIELMDWCRDEMRW